MRSSVRSGASRQLAAEEILERIKTQFDARAEKYDDDNSYHPPLAAKLLDLCQLQPGQNLLDLASGTGLVALPAAQAVGPAGMVVAVDLSDAMLEQSRAKAVAQGLQNVQWYCGDMEDLETLLPAELKGRFDAATCSAAIVFLRQPQQTLHAWRQWLKPGGKLAFNAFEPPAIEDLGPFFRLAPQYGYEREADPCEALGSLQLLQSTLQAVGYRDVQVTLEEKVRWGSVDDLAAHAEKMWNLALNNNPFTTVDAMQNLQGSEGDAAAARLRAFHDAFIDAVMSDVHANARYDASQRRLASKVTVLHTLAIA